MAGKEIPWVTTKGPGQMQILPMVARLVKYVFDDSSKKFA